MCCPQVYTYTSLVSGQRVAKVVVMRRPPRGLLRGVFRAETLSNLTETRECGTRNSQHKIRLRGHPVTALVDQTFPASQSQPMIVFAFRPSLICRCIIELVEFQLRRAFPEFLYSGQSVLGDLNFKVRRGPISYNTPFSVDRKTYLDAYESACRSKIRRMKT